MHRRLLALAFAGASFTAAAQNAPAKLETSGALFGVRETVQQADLSPDGTKVLYVTPGPGRTTYVHVADVGGSTPRVVTRVDGNPERIAWCRFATDVRVVCNVRGEANSGGLIIPYSRLAAMDLDGRNVKPLGQRDSQYDGSLRQYDGDIIDWLSGETPVILMARRYIAEAGKMNTRIVRSENGIGVDRVDVTTLKTEEVDAPSKTADFFLSDGRGTVRIKGWRPTQGATQQLVDRVEYAYRLPGQKSWQPFSSWSDDSGMAPIHVDGESNSAYVLKKLDGRMALYRVKLDGSLASELVYKNDKVDVAGVATVGRNARAVGVTFVEDSRRTIYFDPTYKALATALGKALPNLPMIDFIATSSDGNRVLINASSDVDPGRFYVFDRAKKSVNEILLARPALEGVKLAKVKAITYPSADGTPIPAYLTLPPGAESAKGLPAIVMPHGGPEARDEWGFDWFAQFFAHEGYAVIQPNYRGSAGYGDEWMQENGFRGWKTSIQDVTSAARWLVAEGIADPSKLAAVGWSYGGYASLQAGVVEPSLFKALVAVAPVTDLALLKAQARDYTSARIVRDFIGAGAHVEEGSPLQNVQRIQAPVLMFHGSMDLNVRIEHSRQMDRKLRAAGKSSELVEYDGLEHQLADSNARALMLDRMAAFLRTHLGAPARAGSP
ncbi:alpha/beta hydrolase family protein [Lysobacter humi (ex Lee et al. 2017)]